MAGNLSPVQFAGVSGAESRMTPWRWSASSTAARASPGAALAPRRRWRHRRIERRGGSGILRGAFDAAKKVFSNPEVDSVAGDVAGAAPEVGAALAL